LPFPIVTFAANTNSFVFDLFLSQALCSVYENSRTSKHHAAVDHSQGSTSVVVRLDSSTALLEFNATTKANKAESLEPRLVTID